MQVDKKMTESDFLWWMDRVGALESAYPDFFEICEKLALRVLENYLKNGKFQDGRYRISRKAFEMFEKYIADSRSYYTCFSFEDNIREEYLCRQRPFYEITRKFENNHEMIYVAYSNNIPGEFIPVIYEESAPDYFLKCSDDKYELFKGYFFSRAVLKQPDNRAWPSKFFIDCDLWESICETVPEFVERLKREQESAFGMKEYFEAKQRISELETEAEKIIEDIPWSSRDKLVRVRLGNMTEIEITD